MSLCELKHCGFFDDIPAVSSVDFPAKIGDTGLATPVEVSSDACPKPEKNELLSICQSDGGYCDNANKKHKCWRCARTNKCQVVLQIAESEKCDCKTAAGGYCTNPLQCLPAS
jgi:hypothetical protein